MYIFFNFYCCWSCKNKINQVCYSSVHHSHRKDALSVDWIMTITGSRIGIWNTNSPGDGGAAASPTIARRLGVIKWWDPPVHHAFPTSDFPTRRSSSHWHICSKLSSGHYQSSVASVTNFWGWYSSLNLEWERLERIIEQTKTSQRKWWEINAKQLWNQQCCCFVHDDDDAGQS